MRRFRTKTVVDLTSRKPPPVRKEKEPKPPLERKWANFLSPSTTDGVADSGNEKGNVRAKLFSQFHQRCPTQTQTKQSVHPRQESCCIARTAPQSASNWNLLLQMNRHASGKTHLAFEEVESLCDQVFLLWKPAVRTDEANSVAALLETECVCQGNAVEERDKFVVAVFASAEDSKKKI